MTTASNRLHCLVRNLAIVALVTLAAPADTATTTTLANFGFDLDPVAVAAEVPPGIVEAKPPIVVSLNSINSNRIGISFDEIVTLPSATNRLNYTVNAGTVIVLGVERRTDQRSVELILESAIPEFFSVGVSNVTNVAGIAAASTATGYTSRYTSSGIGTLTDPDPAGIVYTSRPDVFEVTVGGSGFDGATDGFHFVHRETVGDFDVRVRVAQLGSADPSSQAGLMARESLSAGSASIQTYLTPVAGANEVRVGVRPSTGSDTTDSGFQIGPRAPADSSSWLRLTRSNNVFTAYHASNGEDWIVSGQTTLALGSTLHVGLATSSHLNGTSVAATFTNFGVMGARPCDAFLPTVNIAVSGTDLVVGWTQSPPCDFAVETSTDLSEWSLLCIPIHEDVPPVRFMPIPLSLVTNQIFIRLARVYEVIPINQLKSLVSAGTILAPNGYGLSGSGLNDSGKLCAGLTDEYPVNPSPSVAFAQTAANITIPSGKSGDFDTSASDYNVATVLQLRDISLSRKCDDNSSNNGIQALKSTSAYPSQSGNFTFVAAPNAGTWPTGTIRVRINYR